ncbi:MAG TPA: hypothetical protein VES73_15965, partial [Lamprocystis sp. (in: g-proteobacteria)]|nr:hypothetical protein [Lamprocystis sp. (in: g-proteobacteria)]
MNLPVEHALALLARARDDLYVVRRLAVDPDAPGWVLGFPMPDGAFAPSGDRFRGRAKPAGCR